jgi:hypothetical protein
MKKKRYADGGLASIAENAQTLMGDVDNMANTINYGKGMGSSGTAGQPVGFNAITGMKSGGAVKKLAGGGLGQPTRPGRTTGMGQPMKYKKGGAVSASKRADGCATKGKTKGRMV